MHVIARCIAVYRTIFVLVTVSKKPSSSSGVDASPALNHQRTASTNELQYQSRKKSSGTPCSRMLWGRLRDVTSRASCSLKLAQKSSADSHEKMREKRARSSRPDS